MTVSVENIQAMIWKASLFSSISSEGVARRETEGNFSAADYRLPIQCLKCARRAKANRATYQHYSNIQSPLSRSRLYCSGLGWQEIVSSVRMKSDLKAFCLFCIGTKTTQNLSNLESERLPNHQSEIDRPLWVCLFQGRVPIPSSSYGATHHCRAESPLQ